jgi:hypothetical protein
MIEMRTPPALRGAVIDGCYVEVTPWRDRWLTAVDIAKVIGCLLAIGFVIDGTCREIDRIGFALFGHWWRSFCFFLNTVLAS